MMQRIEWNGGLCHGEQKANSHKSEKNDLKMFVVVVVIVEYDSRIYCLQSHYVTLVKYMCARWLFQHKKFPKILTQQLY